ncbi:MAG: hypothetical protein WD066_17930 [Planctomycetaceae bacterium]
MNATQPRATRASSAVFRSLCLAAACAATILAARPSAGDVFFPIFPEELAPAPFFDPVDLAPLQFDPQPAALDPFEVRIAQFRAADLQLVAAPHVAAPEGFVQPTYQAVMDQQGQQYSIRNNGTFANGNGSISSASALQVQGGSVQMTNVMMSPAGDEYVFNGQRGLQLQVTRRMFFDREAGVVRHVDSIHNRSANRIDNLPVSVSTQFGRSPAGRIVSDRGRDNPAQFEEGEEAVLAWADPNQGQNSVLFHVGEGKGTPRPVFQNQNNASFRCDWNLSLKPGETVSLVHSLAIRNLAASPPKDELAKLVQPLRSGTWIRGLPRELTRTIINHRQSGYWPASPQAALDWHALQTEPEQIDLLAIGETTRLLGTAALETVVVRTRFGEMAVPVAEIAAVAGPGFAGGRPGVLLRNQECYTGELRLDGLAFTLAGGLRTEVDPDRLDRLVFRASNEPVEPVAAFLETIDGDRVAFDPADANAVRIEAVLPWGVRTVPLDEIILLQSGPQGGYQLSLTDGSRFFAFLSGDPLTVRTRAFGPREFRPEELRYVQTGRAPIDDEDLPVPSEPAFDVAGDNRVVGRLDLASLRMVVQGREMPLDPREIRDLESLADAQDDAGPRTWRTRMWDGSVLEGRLVDVVLPVAAGNETLHLPVADLREMHVFAYPDEVRVRIAGLIAKLGDEDFETRETATRELRQLGEIADALLRETLERQPEPEVRGRIRTLLERQR